MALFTQQKNPLAQKQKNAHRLLVNFYPTKMAVCQKKKQFCQIIKICVTFFNILDLKQDLQLNIIGRFIAT